MKTHLLGTICFSILVLLASTSHASVVYRYQGENYEQAQGIYDTTMSLTGNVEFATPLPANLYEEVFPISFRYNDGVNTITDEDATSSAFGFATNNLGEIVGWQINITVNEPDKTHYIDSRNLPLFATDGILFVDGTSGGGAGTSNRGSWSVVPVPPALWLFGSGLLGLIGIIRRKKSS